MKTIGKNHFVNPFKNAPSNALWGKLEWNRSNINKPCLKKVALVANIISFLPQVALSSLAAAVDYTVLAAGRSLKSLYKISVGNLIINKQNKKIEYLNSAKKAKINKYFKRAGLVTIASSLVGVAAYLIVNK